MLQFRRMADEGDGHYRIDVYLGDKYVGELSLTASEWEQIKSEQWLEVKVTA